MKNIVLLIIVVNICSCASMQVAYDYDKQIDFSKFKTYAFTEESLQLPVGNFNLERVIKAVENEMTSKGLSQLKDPDVAVDFYLKTKEKVDATATKSGTGGRWRYGYGGGFSTTQLNYNEYTEGTLIICIVDMSTKKIVWQGSGTKTLDENMTPNKREEAINSSIKQILANYPPGE